MKKKILAMALAVVMMLSVMAVPAFAAENAPTIYLADAGGNQLASGATITPGWTYLLEIVATNNTGEAVNFEYEFSIPSGWTVVDCQSIYENYVALPYTLNDDTLTVSSTVEIPDGVQETLSVTLTAGDTEGEVTFSGSAGVDGSLVTAEFEDGATTRTFTVSADTGDNGSEEGDISGESWTTIDGDTIDADPNVSIDVIGKLDSNNNGIPDENEDPVTPADATIAVDVYWTDMEFNYQQSWDDATLEYIWTWQNGDDYIRVDNRSSIGVDATVGFAGDTAGGFGDDAVEFEFDNEKAIAADWANGVLTLGFGNQINGYADADNDNDGVVTPSGTLNVNVATSTTMPTGEGALERVTLGQITIRISKVVPPQTVLLGDYDPTASGGSQQYTANVSDICELNFVNINPNYDWNITEFGLVYFTADPNWSFAKDEDSGNMVLTFTISADMSELGTVAIGLTVSATQTLDGTEITPVQYAGGIMLTVVG